MPRPVLLVVVVLGLMSSVPIVAARAKVPAQSSQAVDTERLRVYQAHLATLVRRLPARVSLHELMRPVLQLADKRAAVGCATAENRAALTAVAFYVNGWPVEALAPEANAWPRVERRGVVLRGRGDLAQHFSVSALIAAAAGAPLADLAGLYKELRDARGGSGFSFSDLAADRAGTMLGQVATRSAESARDLHTRVNASLTEDDMMPAITGLPDGLSEAELQRRFGGVGGSAYNQMVNDIERRIAALPLFK